ncbi:ABC transporter permease [Saccharomonospora piscinae]|uniref:ABC transporter permease n=1 Tax=Saccharomonospora piscinae TaxID=687388 RepID=UPI00110721CE|nr:ABC transporter permease [Saccharomonospora piscinae]TLW94999.1 ABC transporter permease [Saccharomonospora piscinae]
MSRTAGFAARARHSTVTWPVLALLALLVLNAVVTPSFLDLRFQDGHLYGSLVDILKNGAPTLLIALGMTVVIATRGIDLSVGAVAAIAGAVACTTIAGSADQGSASTALWGMALALGLCVALGAWNGFLVSVLGIQPIIATLVLMTAGRGVAMLITDGQIVTVNNGTYAGVGAGFLVLPVAILISLGVFALVAVLTRRTALGTLIEAVGGNPTASRLAGVRSRTIIWTVYVFAALCAGVAGLMISSNVSAADANNAGLWIELDAILAVVLGGTALSGGRYSLTGTLVGALLIQTLTTTVYTIGIPSEVTLVFKALVVIAVCLVQSPKARALLRRGRRSPSPPGPAAGAGGEGGKGAEGTAGAEGATETAPTAKAGQR